MVRGEPHAQLALAWMVTLSKSMTIKDLPNVLARREAAHRQGCRSRHRKTRPSGWRLRCGCWKSETNCANRQPRNRSDEIPISPRPIRADVTPSKPHPRPLVKNAQMGADAWSVRGSEQRTVAVLARAERDDPKTVAATLREVQVAPSDVSSAVNSVRKRFLTRHRVPRRSQSSPKE